MNALIAVQFLASGKRFASRGMAGAALAVALLVAMPIAIASTPLLAQTLPASTPQAEGYRVANVAADDVLNVRAGPGVENMILGILAPNAAGVRPTGRVASASDGGTWWQIADAALPGGVGWVNARFLRPDAAQAAAPPPSAPAAAAPQEVRDAPRNLTGFRHRQGEVLHFRITGARSGTIWGTDIYSDDSHLSRAAVHAGMVVEGETAALAVEILPGQSLYEASERHGVRSRRWSRPWHGSFRFIGRAEDAPTAAAPAAAGTTDPIADAPASSEPAAATPLFRVTGIDANAALYLRDRPSEQGAIVGILPADAEGIEATGNRIRNRGIYWAEVVAPAAPDGVGWALEDNLAPMPVAATAAPNAAPDGPTLAQVASDFTGIPGYRGLDLPQLDEAIWDMLPNAPASAMAPGAALSPLTRALLAVQAHDGALPHARYHLRYGQIDAATQPGRPTERLSLIELRRFNLGPLRHRELQQIHGADNVAPAAEFGEGPHVGWRIVTRGLRGTRASLVAASRTRIDMPRGDCLGFHCVIGLGIIDRLTDWDMQGTSPAPRFNPSYAPYHRGGPSVAAALDMLALHHGLASPDNAGEASWRDFEWRESVAPGAPFIDVIIEIGLGQDAGVDVMLRDSHLMDTSVETIWHRVVALGGGQIIPGQAVEHRPGHQ